MRTGEYEDALEVLLDLVQREPALWSIRQMAADAAFQAGNCGIALAQADTALDLAPEAEKASVTAFMTAVANGNANCK